MAVPLMDKGELLVKIVYAGAPSAGKTTNLSMLRSLLDPSQTSILGEQQTSEGTHVAFTWLKPDELEGVGLKPRYFICTLVGPRAIKTHVMSGVDGLVFIVDSDPLRMVANIEALQNVIEVMYDWGITLKDVPWVMQCNKRDMEYCMPMERLENDLLAKQNNVFTFEAVANQGLGVMHTFMAISKLVEHKLTLRQSGS